MWVFIPLTSHGMSGHSKWSTIKRQKAVTDARRSAVFTKFGRLISVAARQGGDDPATNFRLRLAIDKAREANMPNDNIHRAIQAGLGSGQGDHVKEVMYEGFGPGGVAVIVQAVTDNPNRTSAEVRSLYSRHGGTMGGQNSVGWMFVSKGVIRIPLAAVTGGRDQFQLDVIDAGAEDVRDEDDQMVIATVPENLHQMKEWLTQRGMKTGAAEVELVPTTTISLDQAAREKLYALLTALDELDDVTTVLSNDV